MSFWERSSVYRLSYVCLSGVVHISSAVAYQCMKIVSGYHVLRRPLFCDFASVGTMAFTINNNFETKMGSYVALPVLFNG